VKYLINGTLVLFLFLCFYAAMPLVPPTPQPVPFQEVAEVLAKAVARIGGGGPPGVILASGYQLAAALDLAGFRVVRDAAEGPQLSL